MTVEFPELFNKENRVQHEMELTFPAEQVTEQKVLYIPKACYYHEGIPSYLTRRATQKHYV
jgi:hypothetical protein